MNWDNFDWDQLPADAGQAVSVEYSVDWESSTIYRKSHDKSDRTVAVEKATITGGEYEPQNGILPEHDEWLPADADTAAAAGRGLHYQSDAWVRLGREVDWTNYWPAIDRDGNLTGQAVETDEAAVGWWNVDNEAMISDEEALAGGWTIDAEDGAACQPTADEALAIAGLVCGRNVEEDSSGGQGHCWRLVRGDEMSASIREEIEAEMIDGGVDSTDDYMASNGCHYRW
jgi:hypothetical protein